MSSALSEFWESIPSKEIIDKLWKLVTPGLYVTIRSSDDTKGFENLMKCIKSDTTFRDEQLGIFPTDSLLTGQLSHIEMLTTATISIDIIIRFAAAKVISEIKNNIEVTGKGEKFLDNYKETDQNMVDDILEKVTRIVDCDNYSRLLHKDFQLINDTDLKRIHKEIQRLVQTGSRVNVILIRLGIIIETCAHHFTANVSSTSPTTATFRSQLKQINFQYDEILREYKEKIGKTPVGHTNLLQSFVIDWLSLQHIHELDQDKIRTLQHFAGTANDVDNAKVLNLCKQLCINYGSLIDLYMLTASDSNATAGERMTALKSVAKSVENEVNKLQFTDERTRLAAAIVEKLKKLRYDFAKAEMRSTAYGEKLEEITISLPNIALGYGQMNDYILSVIRARFPFWMWRPAYIASINNCPELLETELGLKIILPEEDHNPRRRLDVCVIIKREVALNHQYLLTFELRYESMVSQNTTNCPTHLQTRSRRCFEMCEEYLLTCDHSKDVQVDDIFYDARIKKIPGLITLSCVLISAGLQASNFSDIANCILNAYQLYTTTIPLATEF